MDVQEDFATGAADCAALYKQYYTMVYRLSLLLLKRPQDAEDAAQTVFLKVMEKQPVFTDEDHARAWLLTVTRNYCRDVQRSFWQKKRTDMEQLPEQAIEPFDRQESLLFEIFQTLPKKQREAVYLYYFEDFSIREIANLLGRKESTVQSQLSAARKRMKKQFSLQKATILTICLVAALGLGGIVADAASGGRTTAAMHEIGEKIQTTIHRMLSAEDKKTADETISLPTQVYAPDLAGIDENYLIVANERGLLIYDRRQKEIAAVLDLQKLDCNYLNANSIATRIFMDGGSLYLFNETDIGQKPRAEERAPLPEFAYIYDSSGLTKTTDEAAIQTICSLWEEYSRKNLFDTFDSFHEAAFMDAGSEKHEDMVYSRNSLLWQDENGEKMLSCLTVYGNGDYELYTKHADGSIICEQLELTAAAEENVSSNPAAESGADTNVSPDPAVENGADTNVSPDPIAKSGAEASAQLPEFSYTGDDAVLAAVCAYMAASDDAWSDSSNESSVCIPAPVIYDTVSEDGELVVFCNLWRFTYYRNGNTLECDGGGEAPARLRLRPDADAIGGYEIIEDVRTGDGAHYAEGIEAFCADYPGMADKYFYSEESLREDIRAALIRMYVQNNGLDIKYYKDYGWDPVPLAD